MVVQTEPSAEAEHVPLGDRALRVDLLAPCFWPEVRRGTERFTYELARGLARQGHSTRIVTSHPGRLSRSVEDGISVLRVPRPPDGRFRRRMWEDYVTHVPLSYAALRAGSPDVAHAMHGPDAMAAVRYKRRTGRPAVLSFMGIPDHDGVFERRKRLDFLVRALHGCDAVVALSRAAVDAFWHWFGYEAHLIEPGVDVEAFRPARDRSSEPTIICPAALGEPRKNVPLVVEAFRLVRREHPTARLVLSRPRDTRAAARIVGDVQGVVLADLDDRAALARAYGEAWVSVLASVGEAFGLVLLEAMACGTPAVGSASGGIPDVIDRPEVGLLVEELEPRPLAKALLAALELAQDPGTRVACRRRAEELSSRRTATRYAALYEELL